MGCGFTSPGGTRSRVPRSIGASTWSTRTHRSPSPPPTTARASRPPSRHPPPSRSAPASAISASPTVRLLARACTCRDSKIERLGRRLSGGSHVSARVCGVWPRVCIGVDRSFLSATLRQRPTGYRHASRYRSKAPAEVPQLLSTGTCIPTSWTCRRRCRYRCTSQKMRSTSCSVVVAPRRMSSPRSSALTCST